MTPEQRATKSVDYLMRTDALASHDYRPEIEAEIARAIRDALRDKESSLWESGVRV